MSLAFSSAPPRRLAALFLALTLAPAAGLVWLGWRLLEQDRALEAQRTQERRDNAADLVVTALDRELSTARQRLAQPHEAAGLASPRDSLVVVFRQQDIEALPAGRLLFYPSIPSSDAEAAGPAGHEFLPGEEYEFQHNNHGKAIESFRELALSKDHVVRAGACLRLARNYRKAGNLQLALAAYEELSRIDRVSIAGVPSELVGRHARCTLLANMGRSNELFQQAGALYRDLLGGRWRLTRPVFQLHAAQARAWLRQSDEGEREQQALSDAVEWLWERRQASHAGDPHAGTTVLRLYDRCVTILSQDAGETMAALVVGPQYVETQWLAAATRTVRDESLRVHLMDVSGNAVNGQVAAEPGRRTARLASDTGLPWTVVVASTGPREETAGLASRRQMIFGGLAMAVILVLTSGYLTARAVSRELGVARLKSEFVSAVSHEFRTPLATLSQLTENLADGRVTTEERRNAYYQAQSRATNRLHRLVERLLDFGRMEAGAFRYRPEPLDAGQVTRSVVDEFEHVATTSGHEIRVMLESELPQVRADREALGQAVWNLLDNAIKYSPGRPAVWVEVAREDGFVAIRVRDQGLGIPTQEQKRLFRKFVRGSAAEAAQVKGTGIGLAMVDYIVRAHNGRLRVESVPGQGSTFTLLLKMEAQ